MGLIRDCTKHESVRGCLIAIIFKALADRGGKYVKKSRGTRQGNIAKCTGPSNDRQTVPHLLSFSFSKVLPRSRGQEIE